MKKRIWELDVLRGVCILGMVVVHLIYDLQTFFSLPFLADSRLFDLIKQWGGVLFLLISGICVTLGSHPVRRGLIVFACGLLCSAVTAGMYFLNMADKSIIIYFGVLHCLGVCMLLWPLLKRLPVWALGLLGLGLTVLGLWISGNVVVDFPWLIPLGLVPGDFASSDYFPLLSNLGFFLVGAFLGKTLYRKKETLLPRVNPANPVLAFFTLLGKWSLPVYLLHQPVITGLLYLILEIL
ncbi:MAG TPA: DUF1624 domain-containing protein [Candidatus Faecousia excrementigallinarum]|uniref:DUF1624 domain-containing protein n=1 Tax=Candidatus Faecousia excrementigallinarum TaxID=2840806 RepID=A0A9D0Z2U5_9FIRM|nr:DUF1624 domain-containing protein [Candidatus Faecousia excrementigallinarum]